MTQIKTDKRRILNKSADTGNQTHWNSIYVATILSFIGSVQFNLYISALWPYIQILDHGTSENFFALTVILYSLGQIIASYLFGLWSNKVKQVRHPLCTGLVLMFIGNLLYILMEAIHLFPKRYLLLAGRFIIGAGSANVAQLRSYASTASTADDRTKAISFVTAGQALGLVIGPAFQLIFTPLEHPGYRLLDILSFNLYTAPASCLMNLGGILLLFTLFRENYAGIVEEESGDDGSSTNSGVSTLPSYDKLAGFICYLTRFTDMAVRTNLEVLGSPLAMMFFALNESSAVKVLSITQGIVGVLTLFVYFVFIFFKLDRFVQLRNCCIAALAAMIGFHFLTFSWPFLPNNVALTSELNITDDAIGCNAERFSWCKDLTTTNVYYFYGLYGIIVGLSFPLLTLTMNSLFSKIIGPRRQGKQQGYLQVSSGLARMVGPFSASALYVGYGPRSVWMLEIGIISATLLVWTIFYRRMIPLKIPESTYTPTHSPSINNKSNDKVHPV